MATGRNFKGELELSELIGADAVFALMKAFRYRDYIHVPKELFESHEISSVIGFKAARLLSENYGGDRIGVFSVEKYEKKKRRASCLVEEILRAELTTFEIAKKLSYTQRHVRNVASAHGVRLPQSIKERGITLRKDALIRTARAKQLKADIRRRLIKMFAMRGSLSASEIAARIGVTPRRVRNVASEDFGISLPHRPSYLRAGSSGTPDRRLRGLRTREERVLERLKIVDPGGYIRGVLEVGRRSGKPIGTDSICDRLMVGRVAVSKTRELYARLLVIRRKAEAV